MFNPDDELPVVHKFAFYLSLRCIIVLIDVCPCIFFSALFWLQILFLILNLKTFTKILLAMSCIQSMVFRLEDENMNVLFLWDHTLLLFL